MGAIKKYKSLGILAGIVLLVVGILFFAFRRELAYYLASIVGICIIVVGIFKLLQACISKQKHNNKPLGIIIGAVLLALGIYIVFNTRLSLMMIGFVIGAFALISAVDRFVMAFKRKKIGLKCGSTLLFGLLHLIFAALMIHSALSKTYFIITLAGLYLLAAGVMVFLSVLYFSDYNDVVDTDEERADTAKKAAHAHKKTTEEEEPQESETGEKPE